MFSDKDKALLEFAVKMIEEAENVVSRHGSAYDALMDFEGKNAILLNLLQIGEKLKKLESVELINSMPIKETNSLRNRITHSYGSIDLEIIEDIVVNELPKLKKQILGFFII